MNKLQEQFNADHKEPQPYGEDGDYYALSAEYGPEQAGKIFEKQWLQHTGEKVDFHYSIGVGQFRLKGDDDWYLDHVAISPDAEGILIHLS